MPNTILCHYQFEAWPTVANSLSTFPYCQEKQNSGTEGNGHEQKQERAPAKFVPVRWPCTIQGSFGGCKK